MPGADPVAVIGMGAVDTLLAGARSSTAAASTTSPTPASNAVLALLSALPAASPQDLSHTGV